MDDMFASRMDVPAGKPDLKRLWPYVRRYRAPLIAGLIALIVVDAAQIAIPIFIARAIDALRVDRMGDVRAALIAMIALALSLVGFRYVWRTCLYGAARRIEQDVRDAFFAKLLRMAQPALDRRRTGDLISISTNDIGMIRQCLGSGMMAVCDATVLIGFAVFLMATLHPSMTLWVVLPFPLMSFMVVWGGRQMHESYKDVHEQYSRLTSTVQEDMHGIRILRAGGLHEPRHKRFMVEARRYRDLNLRAMKLQGVYYPLFRFLAGISMLILLGIGGRELASGEMTLGQFVAFSEYIGMLSWPLMALGWTINLFQRTFVAWARVDAIMNEPEEESGIPRGADQPEKIEVSGLTQKLESPEDGGVFELSGVSLTLRRGELVGLVGRVASGKSVLASRLMRIYDPPPGTIFIDNADILTLPPAWVRAHIAYVPQEGFLFSRSIADNLRLGRGGASETELADVIDAVQLREEIAGFPEGLGTRVGERGITLSGGQRQRVALGRALLKAAPFYILDDPFSGVDADTEERIATEIRRLLGRSGVLLITHRLRALVHAHRIYVMDGGRVVGCGTHDELAENCELYRRILAAQQAREQILEVPT